MDKKKLLQFLITARENTYAGGKGNVKSAFSGSYQLEYEQKDWSYRDVYNLGNGIFIGLETLYFKSKPVWSMSYFGNFRKMTEREIDEILRGALIANKDKTRLWHNVKWKKDDYGYTCTPDGPGSIDEMGGYEKITKKGKKVYHLFYAGGFIG